MICVFCGNKGWVARKDIAFCWMCLSRLGRGMALIPPTKLNLIWDVHFRPAGAGLLTVAEGGDELDGVIFPGAEAQPNVVAKLLEVALDDRLIGYAFMASGFFSHGRLSRCLRASTVFLASLSRDSLREHRLILSAVTDCLNALLHPGFLREEGMGHMNTMMSGIP